MHWEPATGAGFCPPDVTPWLPIHNNHVIRNVQTERAQPDSLLNWYRELLQLRSSTEALRLGTLDLLDGPPTVIRYQRTRTNDFLIVEVAACLGDDAAQVPVGPRHRVLASSDPGVRLSGGVLHLPPNSAAVLGTTDPDQATI